MHQSLAEPGTFWASLPVGPRLLRRISRQIHRLQPVPIESSPTSSPIKASPSSSSFSSSSTSVPPMASAPPPSPIKISQPSSPIQLSISPPVASPSTTPLLSSVSSLSSSPPSTYSPSSSSSSSSTFPPEDSSLESLLEQESKFYQSLSLADPGTYWSSVPSDSPRLQRRLQRRMLAGNNNLPTPTQPVADTPLASVAWPPSPSQPPAHAHVLPPSPVLSRDSPAKSPRTSPKAPTWDNHLRSSSSASTLPADLVSALAAEESDLHSTIAERGTFWTDVRDSSRLTRRILRQQALLDAAYHHVHPSN